MHQAKGKPLKVLHVSLNIEENVFQVQTIYNFFNFLLRNLILILAVTHIVRLFKMIQCVKYSVTSDIVFQFIVCLYPSDRFGAHIVKYGI